MIKLGLEVNTALLTLLVTVCYHPHQSEALQA